MGDLGRSFVSQASYNYLSTWSASIARCLAVVAAVGWAGWETAWCHDLIS